MKRKAPIQTGPIGPNTNITALMQRRFRAITSGAYNNFALMSCFLDGKPTSCIVAVNNDTDGTVSLAPLFVFVTDDILARLTDHEGQAAKK